MAQYEIEKQIRDAIDDIMPPRPYKRGWAVAVAVETRHAALGNPRVVLTTSDRTDQLAVAAVSVLQEYGVGSMAELRDRQPELFREDGSMCVATATLRRAGLVEGTFFNDSHSGCTIAIGLDLRVEVGQKRAEVRREAFELLAQLDRRVLEAVRANQPTAIK